MTPRLLEGTVDDDGAADLREVAAERDRDFEALRRQLRDAQGEAIAARAQAATAVLALGELRRQLGPLYHALRMVFGELDQFPETAAATAATAAAAATAMDARTKAVWEAWKSRLGGQTAQVIDALMLHGEMGTQQIAIAVGCHRNTVPNLIYKLNKAGLINKNGGRFSLKAL